MRLLTPQKLIILLSKISNFVVVFTKLKIFFAFVIAKIKNSPPLRIFTKKEVKKLAKKFSGLFQSSPFFKFDVVAEML